MAADGSGLRDLLTRWGEAVAQQWSEEITAAVKTAAPVATPTGDPRQRQPGTLRDRIDHTAIAQTGEGYGFSVEAPGIEAVTTSKGAAPHVIRPTRGKVLVFYVDGQQRFAPEVNHPGNAGTDWFGLALREQGQPTLDRASRGVQIATR